MAASNISNAPKRTLLENGLWVATETLPHVRSASLGVYLDTGSRDEQPGANGLAHFFEHMVFKGTPRRGPLDIVRRFEATGGQVNAWTSKEQTCFYGKVVDSESDGALDVLLDMVFNGKFDAEDIRKEKDVVIEEIRSVNDSPDDLVHELFSRASFGTHALGRPIAGTEKSVRTLNADLLRGHRDAARGAVPAAVIAVGSVDHNEVVARVRRHFRLGPARQRAAALQAARTRTGPATRAPLNRLPAAFSAQHVMQARDVQQATVLIGGAGCAARDADRYPLLLLHCVLGDGMSSRLFQNIRETHGLVYSIYTMPEFMSREGTFGIGFATDPAQVAKAIREAGRELARVREEGLSTTDLRRAKANIKGSVLLSLESTGSRMSGLARRVLGDRWEETPEKILEKVDAVTRADILRCARQYLRPDTWASAAVVPKGFKADLGALLAKA
ncbi:MAG TPA: pitrilysin family protein [Fibrobacteria bacterium]|jgi:predicted Zn-dependent peptidase|nr:pitrilysin family protein [Fibrobacteria bacterium]